MLQYAIERFHLQRENKKLAAQLAEYTGYLNQQLHGEFDFGNIIGDSAALREVLSKVEQVAPTSSTVLLRGETGTGKELVAHAIHINSPREEKPFVRVNCAALAPGVLESELFGHEKGSFTGAMERRRGRFELADGGTLFLDEVGDLPMEVQIKLLRTLQEREFERVGGNETIKVDVRVVSRDEPQPREDDRGRRVPRGPLLPAQRLPDQPAAAARSARGSAGARQSLRREVRAPDGRAGAPAASPTALAKLREYNWPGNVRELENIVERAMILARARRSARTHLDFGRRATPAATSRAPVPIAHGRARGGAGAGRGRQEPRRAPARQRAQRDRRRRREIARQHRERGAHARHQSLDALLPPAQARPRAPAADEGRGRWRRAGAAGGDLRRQSREPRPSSWRPASTRRSRARELQSSRVRFLFIVDPLDRLALAGRHLVRADARGRGARLGRVDLPDRAPRARRRRRGRRCGADDRDAGDRRRPRRSRSRRASRSGSPTSTSC